MGRDVVRIVWTVLFVLPVVAAQSADWPQFRGPDGNSYSNSAKLPVDEDFGQTLAWKQEMPGRTVSGPILIGNKVIQTVSGGAQDEQLFVLCFDAKSGKRLWQRQFWATGRTLHHPASATAAPTPASDGKLIFAFYSSNDLICLDLDGNLKWMRALTLDHPAAYNDTGMASSPLVVGDTVVVQVECHGDSFATGVNKETGETRWQIERPANANWTSPAAWHGPSGDLVLLQSADRLSAHNPLTGDDVWSYQASCETIPSAATRGKLVYVPSGGLTALEPQDNKAPKVIWKENRVAPNSASPIVLDDHIYVINGAGVLVCASARDGKVLWQTRLTGSFWATPVIANGHLYAVNQDGVLQVVQLPKDDAKGTIVARYEMGEPVYGSPAIGEGALYVPGEKHLFKFAKK